jgi:branched-chain amino acid transport system substrate-binding protein
MMRAIVALCAFLLTVAPAASEQTPFNVNVILPLTGTQAYTGAALAQTLRVFEMWTNEHGGLRGQPIHFDIHDDESSPAVSVQLTQAIAATHPAVILGSTTSGICGAQMPLAVNGPVLYCFAPSIHPPKFGYVFSAGIAVDPFVNGMIRYFRLRGFHRLAVISSIDGSGTTDDESTRRALALPENGDVHVVAWEHFNPGDLSVAAQAANIKHSDAQAILVWTSGTSFGTVIRNFNDAGIDLPVQTTNGNGNVDQLRQYLAFLPKDFTMSGYQYLLPPNLLQSPAMRQPLADFYQAHKEAHVVPSQASSGSAWDPASIVLSGLRKLGPQATATQLRDYILGLRNFPGIDGVYNFSSGDQHGLTDSAVVIVSWNPKTGDWYAVSGPGGVPRK